MLNDAVADLMSADWLGNDREASILEVGFLIEEGSWDCCTTEWWAVKTVKILDSCICVGSLSVMPRLAIKVRGQAP